MSWFGYPEEKRPNFVGGLGFPSRSRSGNAHYKVDSGFGGGVYGLGFCRDLEVFRVQGLGLIAS